MDIAQNTAIMISDWAPNNSSGSFAGNVCAGVVVITCRVTSSSDDVEELSEELEPYPIDIQHIILGYPQPPTPAIVAF